MQIVRMTRRPLFIWPQILCTASRKRLLLKVRVGRVGIGYLARNCDHLAIVLPTTGLGRVGIADFLAASRFVRHGNLLFCMAGSSLGSSSRLGPTSRFDAFGGSDTIGLTGIAQSPLT
jgi:hypothetical protein